MKDYKKLLNYLLQIDSNIHLSRHYRFWPSLYHGLNYGGTCLDTVLEEGWPHFGESITFRVKIITEGENLSSGQTSQYRMSATTSNAYKHFLASIETPGQTFNERAKAEVQKGYEHPEVPKNSRLGERRQQLLFQLTYTEVTSTIPAKLARGMSLLGFFISSVRKTIFCLRPIIKQSESSQPDVRKTQKLTEW